MREVVERVTCSIDGTQWIAEGTASDNGSQVVLSLAFSGETSTVVLDVCNGCRESLADKPLKELMRLGDPQGNVKPKRPAKRTTKKGPARKRRGKEVTSAERWADCWDEDGKVWRCPDIACTVTKPTARALGLHVGSAHPIISENRKAA